MRTFKVSTLRLLVVDRSPALADTLRSLAGELDLDLVVSPSLDEGFALMARFQPHVAIIDADLCGLGPVGAVRAGLTLAPSCDIVLICLDPMSDEGLEAVKAGAIECVPKTAGLARLRALLLRARSGLPRAEHELQAFEQAMFHQVIGGEWAFADRWH